jgi:hypothetical protein
MPGDISDEPIEGACRAHQAALAGTDPETDEWGDLEPEAQDIFRDAMRAAIRAFIEAREFVHLGLTSCASTSRVRSAGKV